MQKKPATMSIKEWLIKKLSINITIPEKVITSVITHSFDSANDAINYNNSVEISGFGKYIFNEKRAMKRMKKWEKERDEYIKVLLSIPAISEKREKNIKNKLFIVELNIRVLKEKMNGKTKPNI